MTPIKQTCQLLIVGGGPAGLSAAAAASQATQNIILLDDNPAVGGQIWRGNSSPTLKKLQEQTQNIQILTGAAVFYARPEAKEVWVTAGEQVIHIQYEKMVLAAGARERFLPFPGWTLPNVFGVGGLQALVKGGWPIQNKQVVVAGTGPLLLAVSAFLRSKGAKIVCMVEQTPLKKLVRFGLQTGVGKAGQAGQLAWQLRGVPFLSSCWVTKVEPAGDKLRITNSRNETVEADYLACAYHLIPNTALGVLLGCGLYNGAIAVNEWQQTSRPEIYAAGECTSVGGVDKALVEGAMAGFSATAQLAEAHKLRPEWQKQQKFAQALAQAFELRPELRQLPTAETIICRCEDVSWGQIAPHASWRSAKLHTRCGMGPCQGRVCGGALAFYKDWSTAEAAGRPPLFPVKIEHLAGSSE